MLDQQMPGLLPVARGFCLFLCLVLGTAIGLGQAYRSGDVRLVGGANKYEGTVLVMSRGIWKSVCGHGWGILDASVVCRQLGFRGIRRFFTWSKFGEGNSNRLTVKFSCRGHETNLIGCPRSIRRNIRLVEICAQKGRSASVVCKPDRTTTTRATTPMTTTTKLPSTTTAYIQKTTLAIRHKKAKDVKRNKTSITGASAANRSQPEIKSRDGLNAKNNLKDDKKEILKDEGTGTGSNSVGSLPANMDLKDVGGKLSARSDHNNKKVSIPSAGSSDIDTRVEEKKIKVNEPEVKEKSETHTDNSSDNEGDQEGQTSEPENQSSVDQSKDHQGKEKFKVTLNGGRYGKEGHVAIRLPGEKKWGVICGDQWTYFEGSVVCRQLGLGMVKQVYQINYYGGSHLPKLFARIRCHGNESHLADCERFEYQNQVKCSKDVSVAGVICTNELPDLIPDAVALQNSVRLEDRPLYYLTCSMEENCLADEAYEIKERSHAWITASRRLLRFSSIVYNIGTADFIPNSPKDAWEWHQCHMHYHSMEVFAHYDILDLQGNRIAQGHKASFCLEDTRCPPGITPKYNCLGFGDQGLSVNCSDNYYHDIDCQWIDITGVKFGNYILKVEFNPEMYVSEITFDNNVVECSLYYTGTYAYLRKCDIVPLRRRD